MDDNFSSKAVVNNEYDYSNILPTVEAVSYLVRYCDEMNKQLTKLVETNSLNQIIRNILIKSHMVNILKYILEKNHIII